ncbi:T9SS sorting signal type C domain-containing protein [Flavobacterium geliluteum]|uniref:T9SS sorting signal type C domain-containing protein n=1 Tax=Flavobacterium geliluteum TaxID=2816120 RepID=A0A940X9E9_9FLAO|nr:T9SS sorting signal type C domain-containing protein [Flavobacterium geliluteum]MBP4138047.1 T9SS sorting signal type C domain-containing protein [Flavobacterium geliluteum]
MSKKAPLRSAFLMQRFVLPQIFMVLKQNYRRLFCAILVLLTSFANASTYRSSVATGNSTDMSHRSSLSSYYFHSDGIPLYEAGCGVSKIKDRFSNGCIPAEKALKQKEGINACPIVFNDKPKVDANDSSVFFNSSVTQNPEVKIWLNFTHPDGIFKQILIGYVPGATNGYEDSYDGTTMDANPYADFYSICDGKNLVIQGLALPWTAEHAVTLGYRSAITGSFAIAIDHTEGNTADVNVFLHDKLLNVFHNLKRSPYTFFTLQGTFKERFVLKYSDKSLGTHDFEADKNEVVVAVNNKIIQLASESENLKTVFVYDISGSLLYENNRVDNASLSIESLQSENQVLLVKVILENNYETSRKIIF